jgi:16S rRNA C967 or C1407 C5-methylase (RsmB/RsmF family)/NOL1/NOP2/fmu family ribosome biogenesis protein
MEGNIEFPNAFAESMERKLANDWPAFVDSHNQPSPVSVRVNPRKISDALSDNRIPWTSSGFYLRERPVFTLDPLFHAGAYYVQEASSMFLEQALKQNTDLTADLRVLDLSAAPGGKSTHLLSLLNENALLVANEVIRSRASILLENIQKWGHPNCLVTNNDPQDFSNLTGFFDVIVVDAPCSGEGMFRKDPTSMKEWSPENVQLCSARQRRILEDVWPALKENGVLIYSTCTYNDLENEQNLVSFSLNHKIDFEKIKLDPAWNVEESSSGLVLGYRFFPNKVKGEGFFLSVIRKREGEDSAKKKFKAILQPAARNKISSVENWIKSPSIEFEFFQHNQLIYALPSTLSADINHLLNHLRFIYTGTNIAEVKHDKFIPEHALALSVNLNKTQFNRIEVDKHTAIQYLRRESLKLPGEQPGYALLQHSSVPIGWVNVLPNRANNLYPSDWRIRMDPKNSKS